MKMSLANLKLQLVKEFKKSLNPSSKFFNEDINSFKQRLKQENNKDKLNVRLNNLVCLNGGNSSFNKEVKNIINELEAGGMFEINKN